MNIFGPSLIMAIKQLVVSGARAGRKPRLHPNGFVQFDLIPSGLARLHVWPAKPLEAQKTRHPIHDHQFDMHSIVLRGCLRNVLYEPRLLSPLEANLAKFPVFTLHSAETIGPRETILKPLSVHKYGLVEVSADDVEAGESYAMPKYVLHDSIPHGFVATLITKHRIDAGYKPVVAVPAGVQPDNDFRRDTTEENVLWRLIGRALE